MTSLSKPTNKMKQNETMKTKNSRLLFFAVDPCKRIDTNEHKENSYLQLNCCGSLEVINTQRKKSVQNLQLRNPKKDSKDARKFVDCGRLSTQSTNCRGSLRVVNTTQSRADSGLNQRKSGISFERNSTQNVAHKMKK